MRLFLASEAKHPESMKTLKEFVGGFEGKHIAFIPTAGNGEGYQSWRDGEMWFLIHSVGARVTLVQLEDYQSSSVIKDLKDKDIIWFNGGQCGYLMYWVRRCELDKALPDLLENGAVYVGSSAGSMVAGKDLSVVEWYIGEKEPGAGVIPSLGLVDFNIYPHYEDHLKNEIEKLNTSGRLYLLKNGEQIIVDGKKVKVVGEEQIVL